VANVQIEHGFTKIANEILEQMALVKLSPIQYRIILVIWRYTYGFNRKEHKCSLSFLSKATNYDQRQLQRELQKLEQRKIISQEVKKGRPRLISFNKNYDEWLEETSVGSSTMGKVTKGTIGSSTKGTIGSSTKGTIGSSTKEEIKNLNKKERNDDMNPNPFNEYEKAFKQFPSGMLANDFMYWIEDPKSKFEEPLEIMCEVIKRAKDQEPINPAKYVSKIISDLHQKGLYTFEAVQKHNAAFDTKAKKRANRNAPIDMDAVMKELGINDDDKEESP
jgi:phage replication O-like protein O